MFLSATVCLPGCNRINDENKCVTEPVLQDVSEKSLLLKHSLVTQTHGNLRNKGKKQEKEKGNRNDQWQIAIH